MDETQLVRGERYNEKKRLERLVYIGVNNYDSPGCMGGEWHQFALVEEPTKIWCEVRSHELEYFEKTIS
jgi:hypothetical protein